MIEHPQITITSFIQFSNIIGKLTNNEVLVDQFATYNLIEKIMNLIKINHKFSMIYNWLENILPQTKHLNITKSNIPLMVQMNHPKVDIEQSKIKENKNLSILRQQIKANRQQENAVQRQILHQVMQQMLPGSSEDSRFEDSRLMYRKNWSKQPSYTSYTLQPDNSNF
jgi:hypothetical protein